MSWLDRLSLWIGHQLLEREIRRAVREDPPIFAGGGKITGGSVAYEPVDVTDVVNGWNIKPFPPAIEDSPALDAAIEDEAGVAAFTLDGAQRAIDGCIAFGQTVRRCDECGSYHTEHEVMQWLALPHATEPDKLVVAADLHELCNGCGATNEFRVIPATYAALKAASAMAQAELAMAGLRIELGLDPDA